MMNLKKVEFNVTSKRKVYFIEGEIAKSILDLQQGVDDRILVESFDKRTGERRYLDFKEGKWLKKSGM
ncbi:hypothetical protein JCM16418A_15030 [Paenibacillus pini]|uniref:Uncharacterized protein n=1 Tax=Paenibacillus pini JCM 16418 TaxID=1236976 RepID=W7Z1R5_9BACL|nr:hypothetical protein [Paenibacillus pini]GAF10916.1 hypothetical protein JCM16418_5153 [Paenibacillus pini JCM 16418]